jgi:hypothetical protein
MIVHAHIYNDWTEVVGCGKTSEKQMHLFYKPQLEDLERTLRQLKRSLHRLQLERAGTQHTLPDGSHTLY